MRHPGLVLGYHGCDRGIGERILAGKSHVEASTNKHDWLGSGAYFWEDSPTRAYQWAQFMERRRSGQPFEPFVIGAMIDPGECLDLMDSRCLDLLAFAGQDLIELFRSQGSPIPQNKPARDGDEDLVLRHLDCAAVNHLHALTETDRNKVTDGLRTPAYDTVRGLFQEGSPVFDGSKIARRSHVQWAVRKPSHSIRGYFRVPESDWL